MELLNKNVIIVGANSGIGFEIAKTFLKEGVIAILPYHRKKDGIEQLINQFGKDRVHAFPMDLKNLESIYNFVNYLDKQFNKIDILINNAGISRPMSLENITPEKWNEVFNTNVRGSFFLSQKVLTLIKNAGGGSIVNISSMAGHEAYPGMGAYSSSKAALNMVTKQMAFEWAPYNIRVNAVSPGLIRTPLTEEMYKNEEIHQKRKNLVPLNRIGNGKDIANITLFLCSSKSSYITGQIILVDGGLVGTILSHIAGRPESK